MRTIVDLVTFDLTVTISINATFPQPTSTIWFWYCVFKQLDHTSHLTGYSLAGDQPGTDHEDNMLPF